MYTDYFKIVAGWLQDYSIAPYLFIIAHDNAMWLAAANEQETGLALDNPMIKNNPWSTGKKIFNLFGIVQFFNCWIVEPPCLD